MRKQLETEVISRRKIFSLLGLAAGASIAVPLMSISAAEAQTSVMTRRDDRRDNRQDRRTDRQIFVQSPEHPTNPARRSVSPMFSRTRRQKADYR